MADIMRVSKDYDDSEYDLYLILQEFQYGKETVQTTTNKSIIKEWDVKDAPCLAMVT